MSDTNAGRMIKHSTIYAVGNISRQLVGFIMLPIYTRYLSPADYGVIGLLVFSLSLIDILFGARLAGIIPKFYHQETLSEKRNAVVSTALILTTSISLCSMLMVVSFSEESSLIVFGKTDYSLIIAIYATLILTQAIESYGLIFIRIQQRAYLFLFVSLFKLALQLSMNIWLVVFLEMGVLGIAITSAITTVSLAILLLLYTLYYTKLRWNTNIAKRLFIFSWPLWLAGFAGLYLGSANRYYMQIFGSLEDVGIYELAAKFSSIIILIVWRPVFQYWQTERFKYYVEGEPASKIYQSVFLTVNTILIIASLGVSIFSEPAIKIMATPEYYDSIRIVPILALGSLLLCFHTYMTFSQIVTDNTKWISTNSYITAVVATILFFMLIPSYGFVGAAIGYVFAIFAQLLLTVKASKKFYDMKINFTPVIYMIMLSALSYLISNIVFSFDSLVVDLGFKVLIFGLSTILILWLMWTYSDDKPYILSLVNNILKKKT